MNSQARPDAAKPGAPGGAAAPAPRSDTPTFVIHWLMVLGLLASLATGLRIAASDNRLSWRWVEPLLLQGDVGRWHIWSAGLLLSAACAYLVLLWRGALGGRLKLLPASLRSPDAEVRRRGWNRLIYWVSFALLGTAGLTGGLMYFAGGLLPEPTLAQVHQWAAWGFIAYIGLHVVAQLWLGGLTQLLKIVRPRMAYGAAGLAALGTAGATWAVIAGGDHAAVSALHMRQVATLPVVDGLPDDAAWRDAPVVTVHTLRGSNFPDGETKVKLRAVRNATEAVFLFEWQDSTRSHKHLPLVKTDKGWAVKESRYALNDEDSYYEDKFGVMFSRVPHMGGGAVQLGSHPIAGKPTQPVGRGYHATADGSTVDVWHWKSVRSGGIGQIDDNHFGPPLPAEAGKRYTGGYTQDPKQSGGFDQNWDKIAGSPYVRPKLLPRDLAALQARLGQLDLDPNTGDTQLLAMNKADTVPYSAELDTYPVGTVLPSVVLDAPFTGDRGDVAAVGTWKDGWWHLEARRKLDTHSKFDLPFETGVYLWVSAFDHSQARHTRHAHPVRLVLD